MLSSRAGKRGRGKQPVTLSLSLGAVSAIFPSMTLSTTFQLPIEATMAVFVVYALFGGVLNFIGTFMMPVLGGLLGTFVNFLVGTFPQLGFFVPGH